MTLTQPKRDILLLALASLLAGCVSNKTETMQATLPPMPMTAPLLTPHAMDAQAVLPPPSVPARTNLTLQWCCDGDLSNVMTGVQCATNINGPWLTVATMPAAATNRWTDDDLSSGQKFYRAFNAWNQQ